MVGQPMSPRIFVSYRRDDSAGWVGRLVDDLGEGFGAENVFQDIHSITPGSDFVDAINETLRDADCVLAVIGPNWLAGTSPDNRRIRRDDDYVRLELATALARKLRVIPVLVGGAQMPAPEDLPDDIRMLARRNAAELSDRRWTYDFGRLVEVINGTRTASLRPPAPGAKQEVRSSVLSRSRRAILLGVLASGLPILGLGAWLFRPDPPPRRSPDDGAEFEVARRAAGWQRTGARSIVDVAAGPDGRIWLVQADGRVAWTRDGRSFAPIPAQGFARVAAARDGSAWGVGLNKTLWRFPPDGRPQPMAHSPPVVDVAVSAQGRVWLVGDDARIWFTDDGQTFTPDTKTSNFGRIAAGPDGLVYGVGRNNTVWLLKPPWWEVRSDGIADAAVAPNGRLWLVLQDGGVEWSGDNQSFTPVEGGGFRAIAVSQDGTVWAVGSDGSLWTRQPDEGGTDRAPSSVPVTLVVFGADSSVAAARPEVERAKQAGFTGAMIYRREGSYRSVVEFPTEQSANEALPRIQALGRTASGAYVRQLSAWCPNGTRWADGFKDCL
ncbi:TIR domain-containing protein [Roseomonas sp. SSH11]|uniref:TIR domain-containing protein n=1 Tax=Pararoseomonas baculiformis TaxID=2820812 RepID=A0ABS4AFN0_9PROT|nr:TIR domain-containing protein [Pararoseomonas baculiformis]MBP0445827.1 TIR domain-containing protein [Pararoseomonas baculiformis]